MWGQFLNLDLLSFVDIAVVAFVIYKLMMLLKGTRAVQLIKGLVVLLVASTLSDHFQLYTVSWILQKTWTMIFVALPVVFQPELRRTLEQLGRGRFFSRGKSWLGMGELSKIADEIGKGSFLLKDQGHGVLIVIERNTGLQELQETGVKVDGIVSAELLVNIFLPPGPLHDGAVIINGDRVVMAACVLPLTETPRLSKDLGTRHRAALGVTEDSDALAVVVSEETGSVSLAEGGRLFKNLDRDHLVRLLKERLNSSVNNKVWWRGGSKK